MPSYSLPALQGTNQCRLCRRHSRNRHYRSGLPHQTLHLGKHLCDIHTTTRSMSVTVVVILQSGCVRLWHLALWAVTGPVELGGGPRWGGGGGSGQFSLHCSSFGGWKRPTKQWQSLLQLGGGGGGGGGGWGGGTLTVQLALQLLWWLKRAH